MTLSFQFPSSLPWNPAFYKIEAALLQNILEFESHVTHSFRASPSQVVSVLMGASSVPCVSLPCAPGCCLLPLGVACCPLICFFLTFQVTKKTRAGPVCRLKAHDFLVVCTSWGLRSSFSWSLALAYLFNSIPPPPPPPPPHCRIQLTRGSFDLPLISQVTQILTTFSGFSYGPE